MIDARANSYDFREPSRLADDVEALLAAWQTAFCLLAQSRWSRHTITPVAFTPQPINTARITELKEQFPNTAVAHRVLIQPEGEPMLLVLPRQVALGVVALMFGDDSGNPIEDRGLTDVEYSLVELALSELESSLNNSQPCPEPLACQLDGAQPLTNIKRLFSEDQVAVAPFELSGGFGTFTCHWVLSQSAIFRFVSHLSALQSESKAAPPDVTELIHRIHVDFVVRLGNAKLHFSELARLRVGDVVVLDQRVTEPLDAYVQGTPKFRGWPGRCGTRQALQILSLVSE